MTLAKLAGGRPVGLDTNVFVYLLEGSGELADRAAALVDNVEQGGIEAIFATLGLAELLSGPLAADDAALAERYLDELRSLPHLHLAQLTADVAFAAAALRAAARLPLADAIHLATAREHGASVFVTNDRRLRSSARLSVAYLDELSLEPLPPARSGDPVQNRGRSGSDATDG